MQVVLSSKIVISIATIMLIFTAYHSRKRFEQSIAVGRLRYINGMNIWTVGSMPSTLVRFFFLLLTIISFPVCLFRCQFLVRIVFSRVFHI